MLIILFNNCVLNTVQAGQFINTTLHLGDAGEMELDYEPFKKINLSVSPKDDGRDCKVEICMYDFHLNKLGQFYFPFPSTIKSGHTHENGKLTIILRENSDIYDGIIEIQACPRILRTCKCSVSSGLQEISARKNLPAAVSFSDTYASREFKCVSIISRYQWMK